MVKSWAVALEMLANNMLLVVVVVVEAEQTNNVKFACLPWTAIATGDPGGTCAF
jgi:hypothetical protein